jgi:hypothetical protein
MRVNISAIGSVCILGSPTRFQHAGNLAFEGEAAETDAAHLEFAQKSARTSANAAAIPLAVLEFELFMRLCNLTGSRHISPRNLFLST